jgi:hypothetical protein
MDRQPEQGKSLQVDGECAVILRNRMTKFIPDAVVAPARERGPKMVDGTIPSAQQYCYVSVCRGR